MEKAARRRGRVIAAGQGIDALPVFKGLIGPDRLGNQNAPPLALMGLGMERDLPPRAAYLYLAAIGNACRCQVLWMHKERGPALAFDR